MIYNSAAVGANTGNQLVWYALSSIIDVDEYAIADCVHNIYDVSNYSSFITTDLIWIGENKTFPVVEQQIKLCNNRPLIPISVGLQSANKKSDFSMHKDTINLLEKIQERCVIGVRGAYTAEILSKYGIKNIAVVGCPSMYLPFDYNFKINSKNAEIRHVSLNMRTMYSKFNDKELELMTYAANRGWCFCEQTGHEFSPKICENIDSYLYLNQWLNKGKVIFFDVDAWRNYISAMDFSIGCRFHGNVVALWEGIKSLFITIDSRTEELCTHYSLPSIKLQDFDSKKEVNYYYELADYSEFNKKYSQRLDEFITFLKKNQLTILPRIDSWYDNRLNVKSSE